ncbi:hypothetical protein B7494_g6941 [Chlorociboria aeruginascens]|nr:hypothetical protein B7494_g6941 [Chlorociboria aeruginascens]
MIQSARKHALAHPNPAITKICTFEGMASLPILKSPTDNILVLDATVLSTTHIATQREIYTKIFSNAALHWILRSPASRAPIFKTLHTLLQPAGTMVFEMGGMGNVAEMRTALLSCVGRRIGIEKTREVDPWFFPDEVWMRWMLEEEVGGWKVERCEREYRPTRADDGGVEGWVRLMGKQFLDAVGKEKGKGEREECAKEVVEVLKTVTTSPGGGDWFGYVRLRVLAKKI